MTLTQIAGDDSEPGPRQQHNHGPGVFIAGNNHGPIHALDKETKALLKKVSSQTPELASKLGHLLEKGVISRDELHALERVAWSINEDVARSLLFAGRNINEDVARMLSHAAEGINDEVAASLSASAAQIEKQVSLFGETTYSLSHAADNAESAARRLEASLAATGRLLANDQNTGLVSNLEAISMHLGFQLELASRIIQTEQTWWSRLKTNLIWFLAGTLAIASIYIATH
ncbi:hypothetical protein [Catelliglobosispora koreensis]|uniref:hypothetical protein n=1 Tax=Catelliglobosispora koreensis TaxID=129052 RepID=UPI000374FABB|nr:hypothetical protein [Catelliglobosispora koreensis]